ncbi:type III PLP-dependent enzyme [Lentisphaerota bacterium WC36G]|nr:type III PLP-dependent enzyme [Lentisphaerae bacterium WC36]
MNIDINNFFTPQEWQKIQEFSSQKETPFLVVLLNIVERRFNELKEAMPYADIYYAVKANPAVEILQLLDQLGSCFDVASVYELRILQSLNISPERMSFGNTIKKSKDIKEFYDAGVRLYVSDSEMDLKNIAQNAPNCKVLIRILAEGVLTAAWPLSRKFGCSQEMAYDLLVMTRDLGLVPYGVSFHPGSQQREIGAWDSAIAKVKYLYDMLLESENIKLQCINMGGGLPSQYLDKINTTKTYGDEIKRFLTDDFGDDMPRIIIEPGRYMVANAGVLISEIVLIARKSRTALARWIYTDIGKFGGLMETLDESIKYPIYTPKYAENDKEKAIIAGPSCDSVDTMYEDFQYPLPLSLEQGDRLYWLSTGAYTSSYCSVNFNGFPPLKAYYL